MTLQIRIAGARHPARDGDPLRRTECGYYRGITPTEAWRRGRAEWPLNGDNVKKETEAVVINPEGLILSVAIITGVIPRGDKIEIVGDVQVDDSRIGQLSEHPHNFQASCHYV